VLGRVIERATGRKYKDAVRQLVLEPCGMDKTHLGRTLPSGRFKGEVVYYDQPATQLAANVVGGGEQVPWPYGGFCLEAMDAHGGWVGSTTDLIRLATHLDGTRQPRLLSDRALAQMTARPAPPVSAGESFYYGLGWDIRPTSATDGNWWHMGSLPGTTTILVRTSRGLTWAALFNSRPAKDQDKFHQQLDRLMWQAATEVTEWPKHDLLSR
jgi:N-acyl-D-amino-acid deacylase